MGLQNYVELGLVEFGISGGRAYGAIKELQAFGVFLGSGGRDTVRHAYTSSYAFFPSSQRDPHRSLHYVEAALGMDFVEV